MLFRSLLAFGLVREVRRFGLDVTDPFTVHSGWGSYKLFTITGTVLSPTKSHVVTTHVSGGGSNVGGVVQPITTSTTTNIHDQFFIRDSKGLEQDVKLTDVDIALREDHQLSAVWGIKKGKESGRYFLFRNHSTRRADFIEQALRDMLKPHKWPVLPMLALLSANAVIVDRKSVV